MGYTLFRRCIGSSTSRWHISNVDKIKMRECISVLMVQLDSLEKNSFINNFSKSDVLIIQLSVDVSPKWLIFRQDKLHWGAAGSWKFIQCSWRLKPIQKLKYIQTQGLFMEYWSAFEKLATWMWWILFWDMSECITYAAPPSNLRYGSVNLGQHFYQNN